MNNNLLNSSAFAFLACVSQNYQKPRMCVLGCFLNECSEGEFLALLEDHSPSLLPYNELTSNHIGGYFYER